jgi:adenosylcobinamide kinase/adenosylcobinamide-phosphate guanylyltransferase
VETTDLAGVLASARGAVLIDGIGTWLAAVLDECGTWEALEMGGGLGTGGGGGVWEVRVGRRVGELVGAWRRAGAYVVPGTPGGRLFRDELGRLNQALAAESEEAELVVAGRVISLDGDYRGRIE